MKITNLYVINGLVDSKGDYIPEKETRTIIAECTNDNVDRGCYYFAFLSFKHYETKNSTNYSLGFIEIPNLLTFLNKNTYINLQKITLSEKIQKEYEVYINKAYEARSKVHKLDLSKYESQNSVTNIDDKQK